MMTNKKPSLHECNEGINDRFLVIIQSSFALLDGAPYQKAGCCEVIEPSLSLTLDNAMKIYIYYTINIDYALMSTSFSVILLELI